MAPAAQHAKTKTARAKPVRAPAPPDSAPRAVDSPAALVDAVFTDLPDAPQDGGDGAVPEILRKNRRGRARRRLLDALDSRGPYPLSDVRRDELRSVAERWARKGFPDAFGEVDDFEIRCANERAVLDAAAQNDDEERFAAAERAHRDEVVRRHGSIEIRGLQLSARVYQDLDVAFVPLHVEERAEVFRITKRKKASTNGGAKKSSAEKGSAAFGEGSADGMMAVVRAMSRPRVPATQALSRHSRLFLVGAPGSGKSTLLAHLATRAARGTLAAETGWTSDPVPFLVAARSLHGVAVTTAVLALAAGAEPWFLDAALRRGNVWMLVDGLDEARPEVAKELLRELTTLLDARPGVRVLVTTRPSRMAGDEEVVPEGFSRVDLVPMTPEEVGAFVDRWCLAAELSLGKSQAQAETDARAAADDLKDRVRARGAIEKLAQTPLLCSVICVVHRFLGQRIPARRVALYEAITNVLLYEWDRAKFVDKPDAALAKLDAQAKRALLARLARKMHDQRVAELPAAQVIESFALQLPDLGHATEDAEAMVAEIRDRNGVLVERSPGVFAFSHLTFQEYLAALEMTSKHEYKRLLSRYQDAWWHEVIVLSAGFPGAEAGRLIQGLLAADGEGVAGGTMLAAQCAETAIELPAALRSEIDVKVATLVPPKTPKALGTLMDLHTVVGPVLLQKLAHADVNGRASILMAFSYVQYEPATNAIARLLRDPAQTERPIPLTPEIVFDWQPTVAVCAAFAAWALIERSAAVSSSFLQAIPFAHASAVSFLRSVETISRHAEKRSNLRALIQRYEQAHPTPASSSRPSPPRRAARSG